MTSSSMAGNLAMYGTEHTQISSELGEQRKEGNCCASDTRRNAAKRQRVRARESGSRVGIDMTCELVRREDAHGL